MAPDLQAADSLQLLPLPLLQVHQLPRIPSADLLPTVSASQPLWPQIGRCTMHFAAWQCHHSRDGAHYLHNKCMPSSSCRIPCPLPICS